MDVILTGAAEADLEQIGEWIARDNPERAVSFVAEMRDACLGIAQLPQGYTLVQRYTADGIRRRVQGQYLIFYRVADDTIQILRVLHGARDYEPLLFPDG